MPPDPENTSPEQNSKPNLARVVLGSLPLSSGQWALGANPQLGFKALIAIVVYGTGLRFLAADIFAKSPIYSVLLILPILAFYLLYFGPELKKAVAGNTVSASLPIAVIVCGICILWSPGWLYLSIFLRVVLTVAFLLHLERVACQLWGERLTELAAKIRAITSTTAGLIMSIVWIVAVLILLLLLAKVILPAAPKGTDNRYSVFWLPVLGYYLCARLVDDFTKPDWLRALAGKASISGILAILAVYGLFINVVGGVFNTLGVISFYANLLALIAFLSELMKVMDGPAKSAEDILSGLRTHGRGAKLEKTPKDWFPEGQAGENFIWGSQLVPLKKAREHFLIHGTTGSGKTSILRVLMQSCFVRATPQNFKMRAIMSDPKRELLPILKGMGVDMPVHILNPFDTRSVAWAVSKDITDDARATNFAHMMVPESDKKAEHDFFVPVTRQIVAEMVRVLNFYAPRKWTLRDLILSIKNIDVMMALFRSLEFSQDQLEHFTGDPKTAANLRGSILAKLEPFKIIAAAWDHAEKSISIDEWVKSESIFLLGSYEKASKAVNLTNGLFLDACTTALLSLPNDNPDYTWVILDEVAKAGKLPGLDDLLTQGRSKGACVVLACQDVLSIKEIYGEDLFDVMLGMCNNRALLRVASDRACEWSSKQIGEAEVVQESYGFSNSSSSGSSSSSSSGSSSNYAITTVRAVLSSTFKDLARLDDEGLEGYFTVAGGKTFHTQIGAKKFWNRIKPISKDPGFIERPQEHQQLKMWTKQDTARLGIQSIVDRILFSNSDESSQASIPSQEEESHPLFDVGAPLTQKSKRGIISHMGSGEDEKKFPKLRDLMDPQEVREIDWLNYLTAMRAALGNSVPESEIHSMFEYDNDVVLPRQKALWKAAEAFPGRGSELIRCAHEMGYKHGKCNLEDVLKEFQRREAN